MVKVNGNRLIEDVQSINRIGRGSAGVTRLAYTPADLAAREWLAARMAEAGLTVQTDAIGNMFATPGGLGSSPVVWSGSHIDTVLEGGDFDGTLGVLTALEAVRRVREEGLSLPHPIGVICFACEESARFNAGCIGSRVATGAVDWDHLAALTDRDGISLPDAVRAAGLGPERNDRILRPEHVRAYVELHVEQGLELEEAGLPAGVVTAIASPWRWWLTLTGEQAHSGGTAMKHRRDALAGAAEVILAVERVSSAWIDREIRSTVGIVKAYPGLMNTIAGRVEISLDIRGTDAANVAAVADEVRAAAAEVCRRRNLAYGEREVWKGMPYRVPEWMITTLEAAAGDRQTMRMISRGGHDAQYMGQWAPAGMIFVRNPTGLSHNPGEAARPEDVVAGANLLLEALIRLAS